MMSSTNLEAQFVKYYKDVERAVNMNEYHQAVSSIEKALEICKRLHDESIDYASKQKWANNAKALKKIYVDCKNKIIEAEGTFVMGDTKGAVQMPRKQAPSSNPVQMPRKQAPSSKPVDMPKEDPDSMVVGGVDVSNLLVMEANSDVDFDTLYGMEKEKLLIAKELFPTKKQQQVKEYLNQKAKNFILLYGVPGTGKTYFAKAVSNELKKRFGDDVPMFAVNTSMLKDCKVGQTEKNIFAIFEYCKRFPKCVLFFDEFDEIVPDRSKDNGDPTAKARTIEFLKATDGFSSSDNTLIIAATNFPENIDSALKDRMSLKIEVPAPEKEVIVSMINKVVSKMVDDTVDINELAEKLVGCSSRSVSKFVEKLKDLFNDEFNNSDCEDITQFRLNKEQVFNFVEGNAERVNPKDLRRIKAYTDSITNA